MNRGVRRQSGQFPLFRQGENPRYEQELENYIKCEL